MNYFLEAFHGMDRLGPGSVETTKRALSYIDNKERIKHIVDVGCGNGGQTLTLAKEFTGASIVGIDVDNYQIDIFKKRMVDNNLNDRVQIEKSSMTRLPFQNHSVDMIWAEGSIYIMGFQNGLRLWKKYLKENGIIACSEVSWLSEPSVENYTYWNERYRQIDFIENKLDIIKKSGYKLINYFTVPQTDWIENFYEPLEKNLKTLEMKYPDDNEAKKVIDTLRYEMYLYSKYENQYGYVFYIMQNV